MSLHTLAYFDQILFSTDFTGKSRLTPTDRIVALAILQYVNLKAGSTYVDLLTLAKRLGIKHRTVKAAARNLAQRGHLKITKLAGRTTPLLIPVVQESSERSSRGDKAFYAARGKIIEQLVFDRRLAPVERLTGLAFLALVDPDTYECNESQRYVAQTFGLKRDRLARALPKLEGFGYVARKAGAIVFDLAVDVVAPSVAPSVAPWVAPSVAPSTCGKARQIGVSERNSLNSCNSQDSLDVAGKVRTESVTNGERSSVVKFPDPAAVSLWRRSVYSFLIADGPLGMIHPTEMAALIDAGLLIRDGEHVEITPLGHVIGSPLPATSKQEAAA